VPEIFLVPSLVPAENFNGHSMTGELRRVMVCPPGNAGWDTSAKAAAWRELGFQHAPDFAAARSQHEILCRLLRESGAEVVTLPASESLTLDAVYVHDASLATDYGLVLMNPGKKNRVAEAQAHANFCGQLGIPVVGEIGLPGTSESGDIVWDEQGGDRTDADAAVVKTFSKQSRGDFGAAALRIRPFCLPAPDVADEHAR
jgi:N-dimethylarginine dimethylaminohydrolase